ncbi:MAG: hypothetical protein F4029_06035 [Gammaproteobacteria bacterium]|nr:hypothetical protein [Gammaproteobacteria bacterium]MYF30989.1 hypothetical protein [Gammaproteobacteria bacterium]MYK45769.1 hypothetical protein [Gammaproteobacteria bacterium]
MTANRLSLRQKRSLYRDGCVVLPGVIDPDRVAAARRLILERLGRSRTPASKDTTEREPRPGQSPLMLGLFNDTPLRTILEEALGPVHAQRGCQVATRLPSAPSEHVNEAGYRDADTPFLGWHGHLDGLWNGATRIHQHTDRSMTRVEAEAWNREPSTNGCLMAHPDLGTNITSFAALVAVSLSDQTAEGAGNLGVLKRAHHEIERFFRYQRDAGGPLGPDGPNWKRIDHDAPNGCGLRHYPDAVRAAFAKGAAKTPDGKLWPRPTLLRLAPGDAAIVLHAVPHSATRVTRNEPRLMVFFRVTPLARPERNRLVYPEALCDIWQEWPGMAAVVAEERERDASSIP